MRVRPIALLMIATLLAVSGAGLVHSADPSHLLDGKTFVGKNGEIGWTLSSDEEETIVFENGLFTSVSCVPYNFESSEYSTTVDGDRIHFEAVTISPTHGQIAWKGVVEGNSAEATFVWTKERWYWDTRREYWFKGSLRQ